MHGLTPFHHRLSDFPTHLFTMWIAAVTAAELVFHFAGHVAEAVAQRERELESMRERAAVSGADPAASADARLIRQEVERCQAILEKMSGRAGGIAADHHDTVEIAGLIADLRDRLGEPQATRLRVLLPSSIAPLRVPRAGLRAVQAARARVRSCASANPRASSVRKYQ
jgi:hypothetical protein